MRPGSTSASCSDGGSSFAVAARAAPRFRRWRLCLGREPTLGLPTPPGAIEIEFATGARMRITGPVDASTVKAMITALAKVKRAMIPVPSGVQVWLATGHTDMRKGFDGLALLVQETLKRNPHNGHLFVFRGRRGGLIKVLWHDGQGMCLFAKRLERGRFIWPSAVPATARMGRLRSRRRSWAICSKGSTGGCRSARGVHKRPARQRD